LGVDLNALASDQISHRVTAQQVQASASKGNDIKGVVHCDGEVRFRVSPRAARAAAKLGVPLSEVNSTGSSGRIRERDVLEAFARKHTATATPNAAAGAQEFHSALPASAAPATPTIAAPSLIRQTIAARMLAAAQETASVTLTTSADATALVSLRQQYKTGQANDAIQAPTLTDLFVKLSAAALNTQPALLSQWTDCGVVVPNAVHVAVAVETPAGLLAPVIRDVSSKSLQEISEQLAVLVARARAGRLTADEQNGGTFTLTNLGRYRVEGFTPLLNLPQSAILGIGRIAPQPVVLDGAIVVREQVALSLTFDHRVADGATAAALLTAICEFFENPIPHLLT
jgi:pyruvate dehydrogenase E2 component (dihydrolipoamide acetyltransferase)